MDSPKATAVVSLLRTKPENVFYEGDLLEPQDESLADRVVGLELNAYFYGLVR
jgi:hypothetical protein